MPFAGNDGKSVCSTFYETIRGGLLKFTIGKSLLYPLVTVNPAHLVENQPTA
jgi:hypothetical protein